MVQGNDIVSYWSRLAYDGLGGKSCAASHSLRKARVLDKSASEVDGL